jgi:hypothetical protein
VELANQIIQSAQLRGIVDQVAAQQYHIGMTTDDGIQDLLTQRVGAAWSEVDVADIQQSTRLISRRQSFLADVQGSTQPDFQRSDGRQPCRSASVG